MTVQVSQLQGTTVLNYPAQSLLLANATQMVGPALAVTYSWQIQPNMDLIIDSGTNQETITVQSVSGNTITAVFFKSHATGTPLSLAGQPGIVPGTILGNPGPQLRFDHRLNTAIVPHYSIIK